MLMLPRLVAFLFVTIMLAAPLAAQCPDGSPPPCRSPGTRPPPASNSVAVLYFDNLSRDTADAYLADGLTEEIIIRLGQVQRLEVKSRFEVERLRGPAAPRDPTFLGRTLNAAYLVTGSVQRSGDRVRLRVALVRAATRAQIWGDVIDRSSSDMLTVESDIAGAVTSAITGQVLPAEQWRLYRSLTRDPVAYEEYLRGMRALNSQFDEPSLRSALAHFARAIARDSGMAEAYAGEAGAWESLADFFVTPLEGYRRLTFIMLDDDVVAVSPATTYRVLAAAGRLARWARARSKKGTGFVQPRQPREHWHIDVSYLNLGGTFYYLCAVLDGYSRAIVHWDLRASMKEQESSASWSGLRSCTRRRARGSSRTTGRSSWPRTSRSSSACRACRTCASRRTTRSPTGRSSAGTRR